MYAMGPKNRGAVVGQSAFGPPKRNLQIYTWYTATDIMHDVDILFLGF